MSYLVFTLLFFIFFLFILLIQLKFKLKKLTKENNSLKQTLDSQPRTLEIITDNIQKQPVPTKLEATLTCTQEQNNQQHYYIVKEIIKNKSNNTFISSKEYEFAKENLYTSKTEARLFYDNKISIHSNKDENSVGEYELYIVNNVFYDVKKLVFESDISTYETKKYLLINSVGKDQTEGRNFESFALRVAAIKMNQKHDSQSSSISTKNSFLDGYYKD